MPPSSTFSIVTEAHLRLPKPNRIFALADAIEFLKLGLIDALILYVSYRSLPNVLQRTWLGK